MSLPPLHASCVAIDGRAILIEGKSGSGKSDLALRLIDRGALLISDDYTLVELRENRLIASPPAPIRGKIEIRGIGIVTMPCVGGIPIALAVAVDRPIERLPSDRGTRVIAGIELPFCAIAALEASAAIKVERALAVMGLR